MQGNDLYDQEQQEREDLYHWFAKIWKIKPGDQSEEQINR